MSNGYRGWGNTTTSRGKLAGSSGAPTSVLPSPPGNARPGYISPGMAAGGEMTSSSPPPGAAIPAAAAAAAAVPFSSSPPQQQNPIGVARGPSNASSDYSGLTRASEESNGVRGPNSPVYYSPDGAYDDANNYSSSPPHGYQAYNPDMGPYNPHAPYQQQYQGPGQGQGMGQPPVIRDVVARRNTRIETPTGTHYPQTGNSGIAQNF